MTPFRYQSSEGGGIITVYASTQDEADVILLTNYPNINFMAYTKKLPATNTLVVLDALESLKVQDLHDYEFAKANIKNYIVSAERKGLEKYGHTIDRDDLSRAEWMQHLLDKLCDGAQYANRAGLGAVMKELLKIAIIVENMK